jgi:hypothetical protein
LGGDEKSGRDSEGQAIGVALEESAGEKVAGKRVASRFPLPQNQKLGTGKAADCVGKAEAIYFGIDDSLDVALLHITAYPPVVREEVQTTAEGTGDGLGWLLWTLIPSPPRDNWTILSMSRCKSPDHIEDPETQASCNLDADNPSETIWTASSKPFHSLP